MLCSATRRIRAEFYILKNLRLCFYDEFIQSEQSCDRWKSMRHWDPCLTSDYFNVPPYNSRASVASVASVMISVLQKFLALHKLLNWSERMTNGKSFIGFLCLLSTTYANRANFVFHEKRWYFRFQYSLDIFKIKWAARENRPNCFFFPFAVNVLSIAD